MTSDRRWPDIQRILEAIGDVQPEHLAPRLERLCGDDAALRAEIEAILCSDDRVDFVGDIVGTASAEMAAAHDPMLGERVGAYRIERRLGEGGMSAVYLASRDDDAFERSVSVKILKRGLDTEALLRRFATERQILANLDHPNIARLYDGASTGDGRPYFVMEHIDGIPIDAFCERHQLSVRERLRLFRKVCGAVQYAHQRLIVHRDLKPANILVTEDGTPKLLDFGIAKLLGDADPQLTQISGNFFTPDYASPEQIRDETISTASDQYSLAVLLYVLLAGRRPYDMDGVSRETMERTVRETAIEKPSRHHRRLSADLDHIVLKAMRVDPSDRYGSVQDFSEDLGRYLSGESVLARRGTRRYRIAKFLKRNAMPVSFTAVLVVTTVLTAAQAVWLSRSRGRAEAVARHLAEMSVVTDTDMSFFEARSNPTLEFGRGSFTVSAWIRLTGPADGTVVIMDKRVPPYHFSRGFTLFMYENRLGLQLADGAVLHRAPTGEISTTTGSTNYLAQTDLADGGWHFVAAAVRRDTVDAGQNAIALFVDGTVDAKVEASRVRAGDISNDAPLRIGVESDGFHIARPFNGSIRRPQVFASALTLEEMSLRFEQGRRRLRSDAYSLPEVTIVAAETLRVPLRVENRAAEPTTYTWTVAGIPDKNGRAPLTLFSPTSGILTLGPGPSSATVPIAVIIPEDFRASEVASFQASIVNVQTLEPVVRTGRIVTPDWAARHEREPSAQAHSRLAASGPQRGDGVTTGDEGGPSTALLQEPPLDSGLPLDLEVRVRPSGFITDTSIAFDIGHWPIPVRMEVADLTGRVVRHVHLGTMSPGQHSVAWDGRDDDGKRVPAGHYAIDILGSRRLARWDSQREKLDLRRVSGRLVTKVIRLQ